MRSVVKNHTAFWDDQQKKDNNPHLSNSSLADLQEGMGLTALFQKKRVLRILEIGIGTGNATRELYELGHNVSALDISAIALYKVRGFCSSVFFVDEVSKMPSNHFDLIICGNVIQHVPTEILIPEFREVFRSLHTDGTLAIQFVSATGVYGGGGRDFEEFQSLRCFPRSPEFFIDLFTGWGGEIVFKYTSPIEGNYKVDSYTVLHICKKGITDAE